jgi:hypothetical protein
MLKFFLTKKWEISVSVGFIKKKFVTMHGNMYGHVNVKLSPIHETCPLTLLKKNLMSPHIT